MAPSGRPVTLFALLGIAAAVLSLLDLVPYVRDTLRGLTRPHRGTWLIWSALGATAFASQLADGGRWSLAMVGTQTVSMTFVLVLSLRFGTGGVGVYDLCLVSAAALGIAGWAVSAQPVVATMFVVAADAGAVALMLPKTWRDPWSETLSTYVLAAAAGVLSAAAVGTMDLSLLLYPVYFAVSNGAIAGVIAYRRKTISAAASATSCQGRSGNPTLTAVHFFGRTAPLQVKRRDCLL